MTISEIMLPVMAAFIVERIYDKYSAYKTTQEAFKDLIDQTIVEINYNCMSGVGSPECHFRLEAHKGLLKSPILNSEIKSLLNKIIDAASLCNAYGGKKSLEINPGTVKNLSNILKDKLTNC